MVSLSKATRFKLACMSTDYIKMKVMATGISVPKLLRPLTRMMVVM